MNLSLKFFFRNILPFRILHNLFTSSLFKIIFRVRKQQECLLIFYIIIFHLLPQRPSSPIHEQCFPHMAKYGWQKSLSYLLIYIFIVIAVLFGFCSIFWAEFRPYFYADFCASGKGHCPTNCSMNCCNWYQPANAAKWAKIAKTENCAI